MEKNCLEQLMKSKVLSSATENCYTSLNRKLFINQLPKNGSFYLHSGKIHIDMVISGNTLMFRDFFFCGGREAVTQAKGGSVRLRWCAH